MCEQSMWIGMMFPNAAVYTAYGMTEASSSLTYSGPISSSRLHLTHLVAGFRIPGTSLKLDTTSNFPPSSRQNV